MKHTILQFFLTVSTLVLWSQHSWGEVSFSERMSIRSMIELSVQRAESEEVYHHEHVQLDLKQTALVLVDVWKKHEPRPVDGWLDRKQANIEQKVVPLLALARKHGLTIIHTPHRQEIADEAAPLPGELICNPKNPNDSQKALLPYLRRRQITTLLYAGYTSNLCVLHRPVGILPMRNLGYRTILLRDCTVAYVPKNLGEPLHESAEHAAIKQVESLWGTTTTLDDLERALQR
ncbi:MAG: cysteine hydrolase [bacterium]|nr:cysteine hydrolase [bacterium]